MSKHCACKTFHDPRFARKKSVSYIVQFARGVSEHHSRTWCGQFIRGSAKAGKGFSYYAEALRPQQFNRLDI